MLRVRINTDNRTVSNTSLAKELECVQKTYCVSDEEMRKMIENAVETAFARDDVKERLQKKMDIKLESLR